MQLTDQRIGNALMLKVSGRIDSESADDFKQALDPYLAQCKLGGDVSIFEIANFSKMIRYHESVRDALADLSPSALASYTREA